MRWGGRFITVGRARNFGIRLDCDGDVVLLQVTQLGHHPSIACHTGRHSCFFRELKTDAWVAIDPVLKDPGDIYKQGE